MHLSHGSCQPNDEENKLHTGGVASWKFAHSFGIHQQSIFSLYCDIIAWELAAIRVCAPHAPVAWVMPAQWWGKLITHRWRGLLKIYTQLWTTQTQYEQFLLWYCSARTCWNMCLCAIYTKNQRCGVMVCITIHYNSIGIMPLSKSLSGMEPCLKVWSWPTKMHRGFFCSQSSSWAWWLRLGECEFRQRQGVRCQTRQQGHSGAYRQPRWRQKRIAISDILPPCTYKKKTHNRYYKIFILLLVPNTVNWFLVPESEFTL